MAVFLRTTKFRFLAFGATVLLSGAVSAVGQSKGATVDRLAVIPGGNSVELEITSSRALTPQTQVITAPDRLIIDFDPHPLSWRYWVLDRP